MNLAFCIGSYRLVDFVHLGIKQIQKLSPDSPILVSDDASPESGHIKAIADGCGVAYRGSTKRRGHFSGDVQAFVNSLAFAEAVGADIAVKVSQRFIFRKPEAIEAIIKAFEDPNVVFATPGQPRVVNGIGKPINNFGKFIVLSDVIMTRVGCISPSDLLHKYRSRLLTEKVPWGSFIESMCHDLHVNVFPGRSTKIEQLTNYADVDDPIFLRRYQAHSDQYRVLAETNGVGGRFMLQEWGEAERSGYLCKPLVA